MANSILYKILTALYYMVALFLENILNVAIL